MKTGYLSLFLLFLTIETGFAADLTWQDVLSQARAKNPTLAKAEESLKQAELNYGRAWTSFFPQVSLSASRGQSNNSSGISDSFSYGMNASLSLFSGFNDASNIKINSVLLDSQRASYKRTVSDKVYSISQAFINLLLSQETVQLSQNILKKRTNNYELIKFKYESGLEDQGSLLRTEADMTQAQYELEKARRGLKAASLQLQQEIGNDSYEVLTVTGTLEAGVAVPGELSFDIMKTIPEYIIAENSVKKAGYQLTQARSEFYPSLGISGGISRSGSSWPLTADPSSSIGISLSYPLFPGGRNIYDLKLAASAKTVSEKSLLETRSQLAENLQSAYNSLIDTSENIKVREKYFNASSQQEAIISAKYANGLSTYQEWYQVENDYISSERDRLSSRQSAALSAAGWKNLLGYGE
jgi:outer membrane protein TolC